MENAGSGNRLNMLNGHFETQNAAFNAQVGPKHADDVVVISYARTAMTKFRKGGQATTAPEVMLTPVFMDVIKKGGIKPEQVEEIAIGNVLQNGAGTATTRMAQFMAGIPATTPQYAVNRLCSSGLQAVINVANQIRAGEINMGIGGGIENMTMFPMGRMVDVTKVSAEAKAVEDAAACLMPMGITSENVAEKYGITRAQMDQMAADSHAKAANAQKQGWTKEEITPYECTFTAKDGKQSKVWVDRDDGVRAQTTLESLGKLKPVFKKGGTTTAGNSSQLTDGAAVVLLARRSHANQLGLPILGRILSYQVAGVPPQIMGIGPAVAIPKALEKCGLDVRHIDSWEVNEAFASQATYCVEKLGIPYNKLNQRGGAIALGHPLAMTGARMICTLFSELERVNGRYGVISMCIGTGMGAAGVFERETN